ncbi:hypothetical protein HYH03_000741 [Edaphochlamys debaryana]|uniref:RAP domain-containing protein n=1 Tax=Edaphochlamys debaryana TaxID=47281 RepID=A0A836C6U2_9CHLO|nr:hypothetical protein HYH03_000741 [Edaphochlamys debaryana]|eukprot:KAG2502255.1 hypothetical protein HYH03_000741 [Edaphochlamys debaryana]
MLSAREVAALVAALVDLDAAAAAAVPSPRPTRPGAGLQASATTAVAPSSGGSGGRDDQVPALGAQQLEHPAMQQRLRQLLLQSGGGSGGGLTGDEAAGLVLGLVASGAELQLDQLAALARQAGRGAGGGGKERGIGGTEGACALHERSSLSPGGWVQLVRSVAAYCERLTGEATEALGLLESYQQGLVATLAAGLAAEAAAGRLRPHELTDAAALVASVSRSLAQGRADTRDLTSALYAVATFGAPDSGDTRALFAAAAEHLAPRLGGLSVANLSRLAWSYAVAGACGLLPGRSAGAGAGSQSSSGAMVRVADFLRALSSALQLRVGEVVSSRETRGMLLHALRIWSALAPHLAPPPLVAAVLGRARGSGGRTGATGAGATAGASGGRGAPSDNAGARGGRGGRGQTVRVSKLQADVFAALQQQGLRPSMEARVGMWSVDMVASWPPARGRTGGGGDGGGSVPAPASAGQDEAPAQGQVGEGAAPPAAALEVRVAVEVDGPTHFTTSAPPQRLGTTRARDACLEAQGLALVCLGYRECEALRERQGGRWGGALRRLVEEAAMGKAAWAEEVEAEKPVVAGRKRARRKRSQE